MNLFSTAPPPQSASTPSSTLERSKWKATLDFQWFPIPLSSATEDGIGSPTPGNGAKRKRLSQRLHTSATNDPDPTTRGAPTLFIPFLGGGGGNVQSSPQQRRVHFDEQFYIQDIMTLGNYSSLERKKSFFSREELQAIYERVRLVVEELVGNPEALMQNDDDDDENNMCTHGLVRFHGERQLSCQRVRRMAIDTVMDLQEEQWETGDDDFGKIAGAYQKITQESQSMARTDARVDTRAAKDHLRDLILDWQATFSWATSTSSSSSRTRASTTAPTGKSILKQKQSNLPRSVYFLAQQPPHEKVTRRLLNFITGGGPTTIGPKASEEPPPPPAQPPLPTPPRQLTRKRAPPRSKSLPLPSNRSNDTMLQLVKIIRQGRQRAGSASESPTEDTGSVSSSSDDDDDDDDDDNKDSPTHQPLVGSRHREAMDQPPVTKSSSSKAPPKKHLPKRFPVAVQGSQPVAMQGSQALSSSPDEAKDIPRKHAPKKHPPKGLPSHQVVLTNKGPSSLQIGVPKKHPTKASPFLRVDVTAKGTSPPLCKPQAEIAKKLPPKPSPFPVTVLANEGSKPVSLGNDQGKPSPEIPPPQGSLPLNAPKTGIPKKHPPKRQPSPRVAPIKERPRSQPLSKQTIRIPEKRPPKQSSSSGMPQKNGSSTLSQPKMPTPKTHPSDRSSPSVMLPTKGSLSTSRCEPRTGISKKHLSKRSPAEA